MSSPPVGPAGALTGDSAGGCSSYIPRNILVTGAAGFIGSHVATLLAKKYPAYNVVSFDMLDYCSSLRNLAEASACPNHKFIKGNILSADLVNYVLKVERIDTIMHFAAQTHVDNSFGNSLTFTKNNVLGTHTLLEAAKEANVQRFIHVSTDEVYGEQTLLQDGMQEIGTALDPTNPYAASKAGAEFIVKSYFHSFRLPVIITRGNNVYGPHQYPEKIVPKFINQIMRGKPLTLHGDGSNRRTYLHCADVAAAFDIVLHRGEVGQVYNIGGAHEVTNREVAETLLRKMGKAEKGSEQEHMVHVADRKFNDLRYAINTEKMRALGWAEQVSWSEGLDDTIDWYRKAEGHWDDPIDKALAAHPKIAPASVAAGEEESPVSACAQIAQADA